MVAIVLYFALFGLLFIWLFNSIVPNSNWPRVSVVGVCLSVAAAVYFLGGNVGALIAIGIWLVIGLVGWGKKEDTLPSPPSEREKLLAEQYANAVAARNEALERSKEVEAEFQRMTKSLVGEVYYLN